MEADLGVAEGSCAVIRTGIARVASKLVASTGIVNMDFMLSPLSRALRTSYRALICCHLNRRKRRVRTITRKVVFLNGLRFGRAYAMTDDTAKAKGAYQDFLTPWKDADADTAICAKRKRSTRKFSNSGPSDQAGSCPVAKEPNFHQSRLPRANRGKPASDHFHVADNTSRTGKTAPNCVLMPFPYSNPR
jgi:hypothetical protein